MQKYKKVLYGIGIVVLIILWCGWHAKSDYTWSKKVIQDKQRTGWIAAATQNNLIDITHPWTIFKQPIVRIAFVNPNDLIPLNNDVVFTKILWVDYEYMSRTKENIFQNVFDCINNRSAFVKDEISSDRINLSMLKWQDFAGTSDVEIAKVICK